MLFLLVALIAGGVAWWMWYGMTHPYQGFPKEGVFVDVPRGVSRRYVGYILKRNGVVQSKLAFEIYARRHPKRTLQAGEYFFDHAMTGTDVFWKLANGQVYQQPFTVREGETMFDIARDLEAGKFMRAGDFLYAAGDPALIRDFAPGAQTLEGFLFPATYELPRHPAAGELTAEMVHKFKEEWRRIASPTAGGPTYGGDHRAVNRIVTLASLVERETPRPEERPLVAGAFLKPPPEREGPQCDPTGNFWIEGVGEKKREANGEGPEIAFFFKHHVK